MKQKSNRICGRKMTTAPTPAMTPFTSRSFKSPGGMSPPTQSPRPLTTVSIQSIGTCAKVKMP